jgi:threonine/homoserine/homoserine lactone efflux protein
MHYLSGFITIGIIALVATISPGPDFVVVTKNTISYGNSA